MALEKLDPWQELARLQQEVNDLFSNFFSRFSSTKDISFTPQIEMYETEERLSLMSRFRVHFKKTLISL